MPEPTPKKSTRRPRTNKRPPVSLPPIVCEHCGGPLVAGQRVAAVFSAGLVKWSEHPVLSKPPMIRGMIAADGSACRVDLSIGEQLRQRAAMGGERERAELAAFEALLAKCIADALVADLRKELESQGARAGAERDAPTRDA